MPWIGTGKCGGMIVNYTQPAILGPSATGISGLTTPMAVMNAYPNPSLNSQSVTINYHLLNTSFITMNVFDINGKLITTLVNGVQTAGDHNVKWNAENTSTGVYFVKLMQGTNTVQTIKLIKN